MVLITYNTEYKRISIQTASETTWSPITSTKSSSNIGSHDPFQGKINKKPNKSQSDKDAGCIPGSTSGCRNPGTHHPQTLKVVVWMIKKEKMVWSRVYRIFPGAYIPVLLPAIFRRSFKFGWQYCIKEREREDGGKRKGDRMVGRRSPYRRSKIDPGVLELSKPDMWGGHAVPRGLIRPSRTQMLRWTAGHCPSSRLLSASIQKDGAATPRLYFWFVMFVAVLYFILCLALLSSSCTVRFEEVESRRCSDPFLEQITTSLLPASQPAGKF